MDEKCLTPLMPYADWREKYDPKDRKSKFVYADTNTYFALTKENAVRLSEWLKGRRVIEVAAGNGYLAAHMRLLGVTKYDAYDNKDFENLSSDSVWNQAQRVNYGVERADCTQLDLTPYEVVVMTWPPNGESFGEQIVENMVSGQYLVHQGERWGCTGTTTMDDYIDAHFDEINAIDLSTYHYQWHDYHDKWCIFRKR